MNTNYFYNKRKEDRISFPVKVSVTGPTDTQVGTALNMSLNGALLDMPPNYSEGDRVALQFKTELATLPTVTAEVVRSESAFRGTRSLLGLKFTQPNPSLVDIVKLEKRLHQG